jgi:hypothetical protein
MEPRPGKPASDPPRPLWAILPGCKVVKVEGRKLPAGARWFCHEGDAAWTRIGPDVRAVKEDPTR